MFTENSTTNSEDKPTKQISGKYRKLFKEFSQESSAGGINKVFSSKPIFIRSIWALLCIVCYGAMIFLSYLAVKTYFDKPTSTFIDVSFETVSNQPYQINSYVQIYNAFCRCNNLH